MKATTQAILKWLNSQTINDHLNQFKQTNPNYSFNETTIDEALEAYEKCKGLILKAIEKDILDTQIAFTRRNQLHNQLKTISTQLTQIQRNGFNAANSNVAPMAQAIITAIHTLSDVVENCKLSERLSGFADYTNELKEIAKARKAYDKLITDIEEATKLYEEIKGTNDSINKITDNLLKLSEHLEGEKTKTQKLKEDIQALADNVKSNNQDVEDKKVKITAFFQNIEEYKKTIQELEDDAKRIISKEEVIDKLIEQAEKALNLKSAEGISAAFSAHYTSTSKKKTLTYWIFGAAAFVVAAIGLTIWIVIGDHAHDVSAIVGRIAAVAISITGATFCARQYVKQNNILEDYAYKSVLAKSIIAFTEEIKKRDDKKVADYLSKVLDEIHKDPLRTRDNKEEKNVGLNAPEIIEKLIDLIPKGK